MRNEKAWASRPPGVPVAAFGGCGDLNAPDGSSVRISVVRSKGQPVLLTVRGELDLTCMGQFERVLRAATTEPLMGLVIDLTECQFISAQGYAAIGRLSLRTPVEVRSATALASKVFDIYGCDGVTTVVTEAPRAAELV